MAGTILIATTILTVLIIYGATVRLTRLITEDTITAGLRARILGRYGLNSMQYEWIRCPWCVGLWIAYAVTAAVFAATVVDDHRLIILPAWLWVPLLPLGVNHYAARELTR